MAASVAPPVLPCPDVGSSALRDAAGVYSQLAGVLAGFAFAGLVALIAARIGGRESSSRLAETYRPVVASFVGLVAASLTFALVAGDEAGLDRAATLQTAAGMGFSSAVLTLLYSLLTLLHAVEHDVPDATGRSPAAFSLLQTAFALVICPLGVLVFATGTRDHIRLRTGATAGLQGLDVVSLVAVGLVLALGLVARFRRRPPRPSRAVRLLPALSLVVAMASVLVASVVAVVAEPCRSSSDVLPAAELALTAAYAVAAAFAGAGLRIDRQAGTGTATR